MSNYNSLESVLNTKVNMTVFRNNSKNDDSTESFTGVDWFKFKGMVAATIYTSGNSWLGFGTNSEQFNINRRDCAVYSIYYEVGTIFSFYHFFKIRWEGYSSYNNTSESYKQVYEVVLLSSGAIVLNMITTPSSSLNGTNELRANTTVSFTLSSGQPVVYSFINQDEDGYEFTLQEGLIDLILPEGLIPVRYIKLYSEGSNKNAYNHYVEVEAYDSSDVNVALNKQVIYTSTGTLRNPTLITDGDHMNPDPNTDILQKNGSGYLILDLEDIHYLKSLKIWRDYKDGRTYRNCIVSVSTDNLHYSKVFSSARNGTYPETVNGKEITFKQMTKYLITDSSNELYTLENNELKKVSGTLSQDLFEDYGSNVMPSSELLLTLINPKIYRWSNMGLSLPSARMTARPFPQYITSVADLSVGAITGIRKIEGEALGNVMCSYSYDGTTYTEPLSFADFLLLDKTDLFNGMSEEKKIWFRFLLQDSEASLTSFRLAYTNSGG